MESKRLITICVLLVSASLIEGMAAPHRGRRCLCSQSTTNINIKAVSKMEIFPVSSTCEKIEVVVTMKRSKKTKCISPNIKLVNEVISGNTRNVKNVQILNHLKK
ncbi:C-X-C motif chemokine 10-like [Pelobates fuscus]|uniref:C-X-C motif chemokine 10-like n=1 Tax=Pelobates fuscus TaxID=191477 RepID=UPI002FE44233